MKLLLNTLAAIAISMATLPSLADVAPHNCDATPTPSGYSIKKQGDAEWKRCYMDSAVGECKLGHTIVPVICNESILKAGLEQQYFANKVKTDCGQEAALGYLPAGVTEAACEKDWNCYVAGQCS